MPRFLPITPSFTAWRTAADRLLALESALAASQRTMELAPAPAQHAPHSEIEQARLLANQLFAVVHEETRLRPAREACVPDMESLTRIQRRPRRALPELTGEGPPRRRRRS